METAQAGTINLNVVITNNRNKIMVDTEGLRRRVKFGDYDIWPRTSPF